MDPEELLAQLKESVAAVQTNVETFENACVDVGGQAMEIKGAFGEKTQQLVEELQNMEDETAALVSSIVSKAIEQTTDVDTQVSETVETYLTEAEDRIDTQLTSLQGEFESEYQTTSAFIDETRAELSNIEESYAALGDTYSQSIQNALETISSTEGYVSEHLQEFNNLVQNEIMAEHQNSLSEYTESINTIVNSNLTTQFGDMNQDFVNFSDDLMGFLEDAGSSAHDAFESLSMEIIEYTGDKASDQMQESINGMIDQIVSELASTISEAIVKSQVGVSVTSATSPLLPFIIAFNKIFDALEGAISAWKSFKEGLGF